jgi:hypothetical protein
MKRTLIAGDLTTVIIHCPVGLAIGSISGLGLGLFLRYIPYQDDVSVGSLYVAKLHLLFGSLLQKYALQGIMRVSGLKSFMRLTLNPKYQST